MYFYYTVGRGFAVLLRFVFICGSILPCFVFVDCIIFAERLNVKAQNRVPFFNMFSDMQPFADVKQNSM